MEGEKDFQTNCILRNLTFGEYDAMQKNNEILAEKLPGYMSIIPKVKKRTRRLRGNGKT